MRSIKECNSCGVEYTTKSKKSRYCSNRCRKFEYRKRIRKSFDKNCDECGNPFKTTITSQKYCTTECRRKSNSRDYRNRNKKEPKKYSKECPECNTLFECGKSDKVYCSKTCQPSHKYSKKLRKRTKRKAKLSVESWKDIENFIKTRPSEEYDLDHIIPLNHPDVCGLHNTWNFQWLKKADNNLKSNKFDGTNDNKSWF